MYDFAKSHDFLISPELAEAIDLLSPLDFRCDSPEVAKVIRVYQKETGQVPCTFNDRGRLRSVVALAFQLGLAR